MEFHYLYVLLLSEHANFGKGLCNIAALSGFACFSYLGLGRHARFQ
ncbi:MAG: hypothetical protein ACOX2G_03960 [Bacillota bacterium]